MILFETVAVILAVINGSDLDEDINDIDHNSRSDQRHTLVVLEKQSTEA
jgi:hypothetical protein